MTFYVISALINAVTSFIVGIIILLKKGRDPVYLPFVGFSFLIFLWSLGYYFWQIAVTPEDALKAARFFMAAAIFISTMFLHFVWTFLGEINKHRRAIFLSYAVFAIFFFTNMSPLFIEGVKPAMSFHFWPIPGILFHAFLLLWGLQVVFVLKILYRAYQEASGGRQMQLKYIFWGTALGFLGGSTNYFLWYGIPVLPIGNILVASYVIAVAIAILKYQLFSIKLIFVEIAILLLNLFLFLNIFTSHSTTDYVLNISVSVALLIFSIYLVLGIYKEIRDRERIEELVWQKAQANDRLRQMEIQKTEFVSIASHQLRTPLTVIKGYASMVLEGTFGPLNEQAREAMKKLYEATEKVMSLVEDLLTVSRIEQGRLVLNFETANFRNYIEEVIASMEKEAREAKIYLSFSMEEAIDSFVMIDKSKFKQAVRRIIENAIKYSVSPGFVSIIISFDKVANKSRLIISDMGTGMTSAQIDDVFKRFDLDTIVVTDQEALTSYTTSESRGHGIGLYIAQEIIKAHHGILRIESAGPKNGTTVVVELSAVPPQEGVQK